MALTGKLEADFSAFYDACSKAVTSLLSLNDAAQTSAKGLAEADKTTQSFADSLTNLVSGVASGELLADAFEKLGDMALQAAQAFPAMIAHAVDLGNSLYEMSLKTGASVENLSALRYVASQTGIDFASFGTTLSKMEQNLGATGSAADKLQGHLDVLHLNLTTLKNEKPDQAFIDIMSAMEEIPSRADQAAIGVALFGRGFKEMAGLTQDSIKTLISDAKNLGLVMSTDTAAAAHAAEVGFKSLQMQFEAVGTHIATAFLPALVGLGQNLSTVLKGAIDSTNSSLNAMGGGGGFLATVAAAMGTGSKAIAAQNELYEYLKDALIDVVRYGVEPMITGFSMLMQTWDEILILGNMVILGYEKIAYWIGETIYYTNKLAAITDPVNAKQFTADAQKVGDAMQVLSNNIEDTGTYIDGLKKNQTDWAKTSESTNALIETSLNKLAATHTNAAAIIEDYATRSKNAHGGVSTAVDETGEHLKGFDKTLADLTAQIDNANNHNATYAEKLALFGPAAAKAAAEAKAFGKAVSDSVQDVADAFNQAAVDKIFAGWDTATQKVIDKWTKNWQDGQQKIADASAKSLAADLAAYQTYAEKNAEIGLTATDLALTNIANEKAAHLTALGVRTDANATFYDAATVEIDTYYDHQTDIANKTADTLEERLAKQGIYTQDQLDSMSFDAQTAYNQMVADGNYTAAELEAAARRANAAWDAAAGDTDKTWAQTFTDIGKDMGEIGSAATSLGSAVGGAFGKMATAAGKSLNDVKGGFEDIAKGLASGDIIGEISGITSGVIKLAAAAANAVKGMLGLGSAGRDAVTTFANSMGGFDALHAKLDAIGDSGEQLWIKLTQGVGKNDPAAAQAAIQAVTDALNTQTSASADTQVQTEAQAAATVETATQASAALDTVTQKLQDNVIDWKTWGDGVNAVITDVAAHLGALALPTPSGAPAAVPGFATGTGGKYLNFGSGTLAMLHGNERVMTAGEGAGGGGGGVAVLQLDGRTVAEVAVPHIPGVIQRYGLTP